MMVIVGDGSGRICKVSHELRNTIWEDNRVCAGDVIKFSNQKLKNH